MLSISALISPYLFAITLVVFGITLLTRRYLRLRHIPGPLIASLTDLYLAYKYRTNTEYDELMLDLHATYGPVVRWGPSRISFASPDSIPAIYGTKPVFPKAESYGATVVYANGREVVSLLNCHDEKRVASIKRHVAGGFSQAGLLKQEAQLDDVLHQLLEAIKARESDGSVHISEMLQWWSFDSINRVAFSDDLGYMAAGADIENTFAAARERLDHWKLWYSLPQLEKLIFKNPLVVQKSGSKSRVTQLAIKRIKERENDDEKQLESDLLGRFLAASRNDPKTISRQDVIGLALTPINAGSETVSSSTALVLVNLLQNPETLARLEGEVVPLALTVPPRFDQIAALPYLDACIRESMRITPTGAGTVEREVPAPGETICGVWVPAGTAVSVSIPHSQRATKIYGPDAECFHPERWTECDKETFYSMDKHHMGFSQGRRVCLGKHLARIEMKKCLASLITLYKMSLAAEPKVGFYMNTRAVDLKIRVQRR